METMSSGSEVPKAITTTPISHWLTPKLLAILDAESMAKLAPTTTMVKPTKSRLMAIGNIIGSNMANISVALGSAAIANPINIDFSKYTFDIVTLIAATLMLVFITANKMYSKPAGISLLVLLSIFLSHSLGF